MIGLRTFRHDQPRWVRHSFADARQGWLQVMGKSVGLPPRQGGRTGCRVCVRFGLLHCGIGLNRDWQRLQPEPIIRLAW